MQVHKLQRQGAASSAPASPVRTIINRIGVKTLNGIEIIRTSEILYCQAESNYCRLHLREGRSLLTSKTLKHVSEHLPGGLFTRIHQSYLVNTKAITGVHTELTLSDGTTLPIARNRRQVLSAWLEKQITVL